MSASEEFLFQYQNIPWEDGGITVLYCISIFITDFTVFQMKKYKKEINWLYWILMGAGNTFLKFTPVDPSDLC